MSGRAVPSHDPDEVSVSQTSVAYPVIRADIIPARLPSGRKLQIAELASAFSVSPGAVRDALSRLA